MCPQPWDSSPYRMNYACIGISSSAKPASLTHSRTEHVDWKNKPDYKLGLGNNPDYNLDYNLDYKLRQAYQVRVKTKEQSNICLKFWKQIK